MLSLHVQASSQYTKDMQVRLSERALTELENGDPLANVLLSSLRICRAAGGCEFFLLFAPSQFEADIHTISTCFELSRRPSLVH